MTARFKPQTARVPLKRRIALALGGKGHRSYHEVMRDVFPRDQYPKAMRYATGGGPPGCSMAFGRALREMGIIDHSTGPGHGTLYLSANDAAKWLK